MCRCRLFYAVRADSAFIDVLSAVFPLLKRECGGFRWVSQEDLHITLNFLGDVEISRLPSLIELCRDASRCVPLFELYFDRLRAFPDYSEPSLLCLVPSAFSSSLSELHHFLKYRLVKVGFDLPDRKFMPHVTIARRRRGEEFLSAVKLKNFRLNAPFKVSSVELIKSTLTPSCSVYETLASFSMIERV